MNRNMLWRPLVHTDIPALTRLLAEAERTDATGEHYDAVDLAEELADEGLSLGADSIAVLDDGMLIGMGVVRDRGVVGQVHVIEAWGCVHPQRRHEGIGRGILAHQLHRGGALHAERHPGIAGRFVVRPYDHCLDHVHLVRAAGLVPMRHWFDMQRPLCEPLPEIPELPAGLAVLLYDAGRDGDVRLAYNRAFADSYGAAEQELAGWRQWFTGSRAFRPELSMIVVDGSDLVAFLLSYFYEADAAVDGYREGWIGQVGTVPERRRQGVAGALLARTLHAYVRAGFSQAALDVDGEGDIGELGIYTRLGFRVAGKRTSFGRELLPRH